MGVIVFSREELIKTINSTVKNKTGNTTVNGGLL
jgi:hypothetical protein